MGWLEVMVKKSILDEIINEDISEVMEHEDEVLAPLLAEINMIKDDALRSFVRSVLMKAESFWYIPSSFSGKYHPKDEHDNGGNVLHTKRTVRVAQTMCDSYSLSEEERDMITAACLLHDLTKGISSGDKDSFHYDPLHPYTVGRFIEKCVEFDKEYGKDGSSTTLFIAEETVNTILRLVRCHLGPWSPVPETFPITYLDYIVHLADNVASHIMDYIVDSELINEKWRT